MGILSSPYTWATIMAAAPLLAYLLSSILLRCLGSVAGTYLQKKTEGRRAQLLDLMASDEKAYAQTKGSSRNSSDSNGWENVDTSSDKEASSDKTSAEEWAGIVGFFHPFW